jgi:hypothetical protein
MAIAAGVVIVAAVAVGAIVFAAAPWNAPASQAPVAADAPIETDGSDDVPAPVDAPVDEAAAEAVPAPGGEVAPPAPVPVPAPVPAPRAQPDPVPTLAPARSTPAPTNPTPPPTPTPTPTTPTPPAQTATPALDTPSDLSAAIPAPVTGTGAPGASVALLDDSGTELVTVTVGAHGRFSATIPGDLLRTGMTVHAVQTAAEMRPSAPSAAVGPFLLPAPAVTASDGSLDARLEDADRDGLADDVYLQLSGEQGRTVAVSVDGVWTGNLHVLTARPILRVVDDMAPGAHAIGIRYVDPASGREGRIAHVTIDATGR